MCQGALVALLFCLSLCLPTGNTEQASLVEDRNSAGWASKTAALFASAQRQKYLCTQESEEKNGEEKEEEKEQGNEEEEEKKNKKQRGAKVGCKGKLVAKNDLDAHLMPLVFFIYLFLLSSFSSAFCFSLSLLVVGREAKAVHNGHGRLILDQAFAVVDKDDKLAHAQLVAAVAAAEPQISLWHTVPAQRHVDHVVLCASTRRTRRRGRRSRR